MGLKSTGSRNPTTSVIPASAPPTIMSLIPEALSKAEHHLTQGHSEFTMLHSNKAILQELC